jgi:hypothetical protein
MDRFRWISCCAVLLALAFPAVIVQAQFGGGGKADREGRAAEALKSAMDRAEAMMQNVPQDSLVAEGPTDFCKCVGETGSTVVARIEQALRAPLRSNGLDFVDTPLKEMINVLQDDYEIPVQLDLPALDEVGLGPEEPVTINLHNISLQSAMRLMLKSLGLTYIIDCEVLLITTPEEAESHLKACVYDIGGLIDADQPKSIQALVDAIVSCTETETWTNNGGVGNIRPLPPNLLVISQTQAVHEEIHDLLATIREMRQKQVAVGVEPATGVLREPEPAVDEAFKD